ncbi:MAG: orotate phosphoribosyltransferase [Candidatus Omnitrophica bacterium]|nr:orotate phosphoribosyltransferase [Candidatus Omnitrophota bacterium]
MTSEIEKCRQRLFEILKKDAFSFGKFILSSGKESSFYLDARRVTLNAEGAYLCGKIILEMVKNDKFDAIGGPTLGADPLVGALGVLSFEASHPVNTFIIRKAPKAHGKQQQVEGPLIPDGGTVILVDDVATTGKAFVESLDVLDKIGIKVNKCVCIIDRNEGGREEVKARGCELVSIFQAEEFLK